MTASFLKEKRKWVDSDVCWWRKKEAINTSSKSAQNRKRKSTRCGRGFGRWRQRRSRRRKRREEALKSRKGFGYDVKKASIRLSNTAVSGGAKPS